MPHARWHRLRWAGFVLTIAASRAVVAQSRPPLAPPPVGTLLEAQAVAREVSPELRAAREAATAARARERQASAFANPTLSYGREQTARAGQSNAQDIAQLEQPLEIGGQRRARRDAARLRADALGARLVAAERALDYDVARAYATLAGAARRAALAAEAASAFAEAQRVTAQRLAAGDVSGYAARRVQLEATRYAVQRAAVLLELRIARLAFAALVVRSPDSVAAPIASASARETREPLPALEVLRATANASRAELRALTLEAAIASSDARLAAAERTPTPILSAGYKRETIASGAGVRAVDLHGFVAGVSLPLPVLDRRGASIAAASADVRRRDAEIDALRRRIRLDVDEAYAALEAVDAQLALLQPQLGDNAQRALRAVQVAYAEGEITLVEWLDAVRAYQEAESAFATLQADAMIRRAALERAVGVPLFGSSTR